MNDATLKSEQDHAYSKIRAVCLFPYLMTIIFWILNSEIKWLKKFSHLKQKLEEAYRDGRVRYSVRYSVICKITVRYYVMVTGYWLHIVNECVSECFTLTTALHKRCKLLKHYIFQSFFVPHSQSCVQLAVTHGLQDASLPCPPLSPGVCSNSCPLSHDVIQSFHPFFLELQ